METGYLLQRFEEYEGVSILATNFANNIDEAFKRRIKFLVRFPFPSAQVRLQLWKSMIPEEAAAETAINFDFYAWNFELPGSGIKEVVRSAAYLAAAEGTIISDRQIREALKLYYLKFGKRLGEQELEN